MVVDSEKQIQAAVCTLYQQVSDLKLSFLIQKGMLEYVLYVPKLSTFYGAKIELAEKSKF